MARKYVMFFLATCCMILISSCRGGKNGVPDSIGQPYEVVLEGDTDSIVAQMLMTDVPCLPQPEPMFSIIHVRKGKTSSLYQMVRNRVVVDVDARNKGYAVKKTEDENASPQIVIRISAQSVEQLKAHLDGEKLCRLLNQHELEHLAAIIKQNVEKQKKVKQLFGIDMKIPLDMDASKKSKNFLWLSNNANSGMQSLLFLRVKSEEKRVKNSFADSSYDDLKTEVDSILRKNMLGETDGMYMFIPQLADRGLWEMEGDAMGGPYVMRCVHQAKSAYSIVVIGFVYAPEMKKRNLVKQLEAVLSTINMPHSNHKK